MSFGTMDAAVEIDALELEYEEIHVKKTLREIKDAAGWMSIWELREWDECGAMDRLVEELDSLGVVEKSITNVQITELGEEYLRIEAL